MKVQKKLNIRFVIYKITFTKYEYRYLIINSLCRIKLFLTDNRLFEFNYFYCYKQNSFTAKN